MPHVNVAKIVELTTSRGWTQARLAKVAEIDVDTVCHIFAAARRGKPSRRCAVDTIEQLAMAFGLDVSTILCDETGRPLQGSVNSRIGSWHIKSEGQRIRAVNGLVWRECELVHVEDEERARGKVYDLHDPPTKEQSAIETCLKRHRLVCKRVGKHPNVIFNLDIIRDPADPKRWWVIDESVEATKLSDLLPRGALPASLLSSTMKAVANGLAALHAVDVIRRDLNPRSILVSDQTAILTDFELAKLPGAIPTVAINATWPEDAYRAPEVAGANELSPDCDLYSWAMILVHAATGRPPGPPREAQTRLRSSSLPRRVANFASQCLEPEKQRPESIGELLSALRSWR
jgi:hypothetical protein